MGKKNKHYVVGTLSDSVAKSRNVDYDELLRNSGGTVSVESGSKELSQSLSKKKKRKSNVDSSIVENAAFEEEHPSSNQILHEVGSVQCSSKKKKKKYNNGIAIHEIEAMDAEHSTSNPFLCGDELTQKSSKKKKRKSNDDITLYENGAVEAEDSTSGHILHESVQSSTKKKKRTSNIDPAIEEDGAFEREHPTQNGLFRGDNSNGNRSRKKDPKKQIASGNLMDMDDSLAPKNKAATNNESILEPVGVKIAEQPKDKYVVGSLCRLFGGVPMALPAESAVTITEGETKIKPKKNGKDASNNRTILTEKDVQPDVAVKTKDRTQQRMNRKRARERDMMTLEEKKRTIFVGNAPLTMDERSCKKLFSQYGKVESVRMRCIFPSKETVSKRIAHLSHSFHEMQTSLIFYVKFKDEESVQKALAYNGTILERHRIRVDTCVSKAQYDRNLTVFVGNVPLDTKEDDLANFFEESVGDVSFARCVKDQSTGMGKGFAFVVFKSPTSVPIALSMTGLQFHKRELRIMKVMKKKKVAKLQSTKKDAQVVPSLTKGQSMKIDQYKFSTRKSQTNKRPYLKKKERKAIQRKKGSSNVKSIMQ